MDHILTSLSDLRSQLSASRRSAWVRAVVGPVGSERHRLLALEALVGPKPAGWTERLWRYAECTFVSAQVSSRRVAQWCREGEEQAVVVGPVTTTVTFRESTQYTRLHVPSLAQYGGVVLDWPSSVHKPGLANVDQLNAPQNYLVGDGNAPSFPAFGAAFNAFFYDDYAVTGAAVPQLNSVIVRVVDRRARIRGVRITPTLIDVRLSGSDLNSTTLELFGAEYRMTMPVEGPRVGIPLPSGLPTDAWLWLKAGMEWLDFRPLRPWGGRLSPDVEHELPHDPAAELSELVARGEGSALEYKEKLPETRDEKRKVFKTAVAFANASGGTIVFGIEDETGRITGIRERLPVARHRLNDLVRDLIRPSPRVRIESGEIDGCELLVLHVNGGGATIHALVLDANKPEYYVRREATTYFARPEELELIAGRNAIPDTGPPRLRGAAGP